MCLVQKINNSTVNNNYTEIDDNDPLEKSEVNSQLSNVNTN